MGNVTVDPQSLESASATVQAAHDHGLTMLARAIIDDVWDGVGPSGHDVVTSALPVLLEAVSEATAAIAGHLKTAAGAYRRTEWLVQVSFVGKQ